MKRLFATPAPTLLAMPYWVAEQRGFFAHEGIEAALEIAPMDEIRRGLRVGDFLMSMDSPDGYIIDAMQGGPLRVLAGYAARPPLYVIAQPEIKRIADLKGKRFGVISLEEGSSQLIARMMTSAGFTADQYEVAQVGSGQVRTRLLAARAIDAALQPMPLQCEAEEAGFNNLGWAGEYEPDYQFLTINGNATHDQKLKVAALRALLRGHRHALEHPAEAASIVASRMSTKVEWILRSIGEAVRLRLFDEHLNVSEPGMRVVANRLIAKGVLPADSARAIVARCVDAECLGVAQRSLASGPGR